ncbi:MAG: hypothetical protein KH288_05190 [Peptoniphilus harei]|nr:hypothetical protein [Peptoniphilus harei]
MSTNSGRLLTEMTYVSGVSKESYLEEDLVFKDLLFKLMFDYIDDNKFLYKKILQNKVNR